MKYVERKVNENAPHRSAILAAFKTRCIDASLFSFSNELRLMKYWPWQVSKISFCWLAFLMPEVFSFGILTWRTNSISMAHRPIFLRYEIPLRVFLSGVASGIPAVPKTSPFTLPRLHDA